MGFFYCKVFKPYLDTLKQVTFFAKYAHTFLGQVRDRLRISFLILGEFKQIN